MAEGGFDRAFRDSIERYARGPEFANAVGPANASALAQQTGEGLGIQNVRRGVGRAALTGQGSNITVSATSFAVTSPELSLEMQLSGRPLEVILTGSAAAGGGGSLIIDVQLRGVSISGAVNGMYFTAGTAAQGFTAVETIMAPAPGRATLRVVAFRNSANGSIYVGANDRLVLMAKEL